MSVKSSSDSLCLLLCGGAVHPERSEKGLCSHHRFSPRTTSYCRACGRWASTSFQKCGEMCGSTYIALQWT